MLTIYAYFRLMLPTKDANIALGKPIISCWIRF